MEIQIIQKDFNFLGSTFTLESDKEAIGKVYLYRLQNSLHTNPYGYIEDLSVKEQSRGKGFGSILIKHLCEVAKAEKLYKMICNSRFSRNDVHKFYRKHGFKDHGIEFRKN